jgi:hypothetical protein
MVEAVQADTTIDTAAIAVVDRQITHGADHERA